MSFFDELKRRNVFKVGVAYVVGAWLLIQFSDILLDNMDAPAWILQAIMLVLVIGLFITLFFAWAFEMTPEGVKREKDVDRSQSITPQTGKKLNNAILIMMALAIAYLLFDKFSERGPEPGAPNAGPAVEAPAGQSALTSTTGTTQQATGAEPVVDRQSIAVLPFENRSNREEDQFFTDGIHDDLLTTIAKIGSMKVISRTSVMEYKDTTKKIPEIAAELGVATVLEGGIQRAGDQVRINVQLIDAQTDEHLWAEIYDRELTARNLFAIQSEISQAIATALKATLSPEEKGRINRMPTDNLEAYNAYLRGRLLMATRQSDKLEQAIGAFRKATELDPGFALAWIGLADSNNLLTGYGSLSTEVSIPIQEEAVRHALTIDDQSGEAYASLGQVQATLQHPGQAEAAFQKAIELSPNYATAYHWYANFLLNYPLRSQQTLELARKAVELDPRSMIIGSMLGSAYQARGLYSLAERQYQKVIALYPDSAQPLNSLAALYGFSMGRFDKAIAMSRKAHALDPGSFNPLLSQLFGYLNLEDIEKAEAVRTQIEDISNQHVLLGLADLLIANAKNNPAAMRESINWLLPKLRLLPGGAQFAAQTALAIGDTEKAREIYLNANPGWLDTGQWQALINQYTSSACVVAWIMRNTGEPELGTQLLQQATHYLDDELAAIDEHVDNQAPDVCYLVAGDKEKALASIETQLAHNHLAFWDIAHALPMYEQIRFEPRFQAAVAERARRIAIQREAVAKMDKT